MSDRSSLSVTETLRVVAGALEGARRVLFVTGAGLSADAGLPTYRGVGGLYEGRSTEEGLPIEVALSGPTFQKDPALTWRYLKQIEARCRGAEPSPGHRFMAALEARCEVVVLTQNVDGLHQAAGSSRVIAIHGDVHRLACTACAHRARVADYAGLPDLPTCPLCGAVVRPEVVLFEEMLPAQAVAELEQALARSFDLVFAVGTTALFPYIAGPVVQAARQGRPTVEVNPARTVLSDIVRHRLPITAAEAFSALRDLIDARVS